MLRSTALLAGLREARDRYDVVVIDCPAVRHADHALNISDQCSTSVLVVAAETSSSADVKHAIQELTEGGLKTHCAIINGVRAPYLEVA